MENGIGSAQCCKATDLTPQSQEAGVPLCGGRWRWILSGTSLLSFLGACGLFKRATRSVSCRTSIPGSLHSNTMDAMRKILHEFDRAGGGIIASLILCGPPHSLERPVSIPRRRTVSQSDHPLLAIPFRRRGFKTRAEGRRCGGDSLLIWCYCAERVRIFICTQVNRVSPTIGAKRL